MKPMAPAPGGPAARQRVRDVLDRRPPTSRSRPSATPKRWASSTSTRRSLRRAARAASAETTVMGAARDAAWAIALPFLDAMAAKVYRLGNCAGNGSVKIINQLLAGVHIAAAAEAMALGLREGVDAAALYDVITHSAGNSWMFENRMAHVLAGDYTPPSAVGYLRQGPRPRPRHRAGESQVPAAAAREHGASDVHAGIVSAGFAGEDDAVVIKIFQGINLPGSSSRQDNEFSVLTETSDKARHDAAPRLHADDSTRAPIPPTCWSARAARRPDDRRLGDDAPRSTPTRSSSRLPRTSSSDAHQPGRAAIVDSWRQLRRLLRGGCDVQYLLRQGTARPSTRRRAATSALCSRR